MIVALIPARAGSKRLLNKNLLPIDGIPLLVRAIKTCQRVADVVYVSTEDPTIASLAVHHGAQHLSRPLSLADDNTTVDQVVAHHFPGVDKRVLVYQPTMVGVAEPDIKRMIDQAIGPSALGVGIHGIWSTTTQRLDERINAQMARGGPYMELGVRFYPNGVRDGSILTVFPVSSVPVFDIDTPSDFVAAEAFLKRRHIVIRFAYSKAIGSGHYRRALTLAEALQHHNVSLRQIERIDSHTDERLTLPEEFTQPYPYVPDLIINDCLDTTEAEMAELRRVAPVIALEDLGSGSRLANMVINDLYGPTLSGEIFGNEYTGHRYAILRPEFMARPPKPIADRTIPILVSFGGTDPNDLTTKVQGLLGDHASYIAPPGSKRHYEYATIDGLMAPLLADTRLLITSAGRTVYEAAALGTPAIVIGQNGREGTHTHLGPQYGNLWLGNHHFADWTKVRKAHKITDEALQEMSDTAYDQMDHKGLERVVALIESVLLEAR